MRSNYLQEGLLQGDLDDLIKPLISIDEYESKISDDNIVVGFYADDKEPATDLARFISKSEIDILDAEVSPVPNEEGVYLVFVEFIRDETFVDDITSLVDSMAGLTSIETWQFKAYKREVMDFTEENLKRFVRIKPKKKTARLESMLMDTIDIKLLEGKLLAGDLTYSVRAIGDYAKIIETYNLAEQPMLLESTQEFKRLASNFGLNWNIGMYKDYVLASNQDEAILLVKHEVHS